MGYGRAIARNTFWMIGGKIVTTILSLIITAQLARQLGVFGYGQFTTVFAFLTFFGVIADFGFFNILVRELAQHPDQEVPITNTIFTIRTLFGIVVYMVAGLLVWLFPYAQVVKLGIVVIAAASLVLSINSTLIGVFQAHHQMQKAVLGDVASRCFLLILILYGLGQHWSLLGIFYLYVLANLLNLLITLLFLRPVLPLAFRRDPALWHRLFLEAWPMGVVTMLGIIYFRIDTVILSILKPATDVGIYGAPYKIFEVIEVIPSVFMGNVFPVISRLISIDPKRLPNLIQQAFDVLVIGAVAVIAGLFVLAEGIIRLVAGREFLKASTITLHQVPITAVGVLMILSFALGGIFLAHLWSRIIIGFGRQRDLIRPGIIAVILNVVLNLLFIPRGTYVAAALITIITEAYIVIAWGMIAHRYLPVRLDLSRVAKAVLAALIMGVSIWPLRSAMILEPIIVGALVYTGSLWLLRAFPKEILGYLSSKTSE